jgi:hypothetical protein
MTTLRNVRLITLTAVLSVAACERPTGPELLAKMDQAQTDLLSDTTAERLLSWRFAGGWGLSRLLPNDGMDQNLVANVDGEDHRFKAFIFERVVVRLDQHDAIHVHSACDRSWRSRAAVKPFFSKGRTFPKSWVRIRTADAISTILVAMALRRFFGLIASDRTVSKEFLEQPALMTLVRQETAPSSSSTTTSL